MSDPGIKLFGMTIALPPAAGEEGGGHDLAPKGSPPPNQAKEDKEQDSPKSEEKFDPVTSTSADDVQKLSSDGDDRKANGQTNDSSNPQDKPLKKPDKILPCPRCNSMDTKFCYYNNYNVNQPRHFCKNCQRYWTAGGTMRNVPFGAGRRKNKISAYRHLTVSGITLQANLKSNGTVLSFGADTPICDSTASVLNLSDRTRMNCNQNDELSSGSSAAATVSNSSLIDGGNGANLHEPVIQYCQGFGPHLPYADGSPWPHPWSPPSIQFYAAAAYWGCSNWGMPWFSPQLPPPPTIISAGLSESGSISPTLGKHPREGNTLARDDNNTNDSNSSDKRDGFRQGNLWIPKTLRIDDPEEAAKSSIWATMGFKNDKGHGISSRGGLFKAFEAKARLNNHKVDSNSQVFCANPAALSRSINFQERS